MIVADKYRLEQAIGWSDGAEVYQGPDDARRQPTAVKVRRGADGDRERFVSAARDQQAASEGGCKQTAPIFEAGRDGDDAYYVTRRFPRSAESLIKGRAALEPAALGRIASGALKALEELRDRQGRAHGNLKPANLFLDGKNPQSPTVVLGDLAPRAESGDQGADCYALGAVLCQLVRGRAVRHFDWPIVASAEWERLGSQAGAWREFCNVLMAPETASRPDALAVSRDAYKHMGKLGAKAEERARDIAEASGEEYQGPARSKKGLWIGVGTVVAALTGGAVVLGQPANSQVGRVLRNAPVLASLFRMLDVPKVVAASQSTPTPPPRDAANPNDGQARPAATPGRVASADPSPTPFAEPSPAAEATPTVAMETPAPTPEAPAPTPDAQAQAKADYFGRLEQLQRYLVEPATRSNPEGLNEAIRSMKGLEDYRTVAFVQSMPDRLEASADEPDLPAALWQKLPPANQPTTPGSVAYTHKGSNVPMTFNKVTDANGQGFFVAATTVPMQMGFALATAGGAATALRPVSGAVSWQVQNAKYYLRPLWIDDPASKQYYAGKGNDALVGQGAMAVMNGLSAVQAATMARAAGCSLPTLAQWKALLASPAGKYWQENWKGEAKVRGPAWSEFVKKLKAGIGTAGGAATGVHLPNDQCFGETGNLEPVGVDGSSNFFFEAVNLRLHEGYCHLVGNVGQYVSADGNGAPFYFAGGSAESSPSVFARGVDDPPPVPGAIPYADGSFRLAAKPAKKAGSEAAFVRLSDSLKAELARVGSP